MAFVFNLAAKEAECRVAVLGPGRAVIATLATSLGATAIRESANEFQVDLPPSALGLPPEFVSQEDRRHRMKAKAQVLTAEADDSFLTKAVVGGISAAVILGDAQVPAVHPGVPTIRIPANPSPNELHEAMCEAARKVLAAEGLVGL